MIWVHAIEVGLGDAVQLQSEPPRVVVGVVRSADGMALQLRFEGRQVVEVSPAMWVRLDRLPVPGVATLWEAHPHTASLATRVRADIRTVSEGGRHLLVELAGADPFEPLRKFVRQNDGHYREQVTRWLTSPRWLTVGYRKELF